MPDLWPEDFGSANAETPPIVLLREQAELITKKTSGRIVGQVESRMGHPPQFAHFLVLIAPFLDDYRFSVLSVQHPIEFYPLEIFADGVNGGNPLPCSSPAAFETALRNIFAAEKIRKVIAAILSQSDAVTVGGS